MVQSWLNRTIYNPVAIAPLVTFRILFGAMMFISTVRFVALGWVHDHYVKPIFHFKYFGFEWVNVLPPFWMYVIHLGMALGALGVMIGYRYRLSATILFLTFTYTELIDLTYYLNHYYFVSMISGLMIFLPAHRSLSLDVLRAPSIRLTEVPAWTTNVIKFQLAVVYIFAGVAKINYDWLILGLPMKIWLPAHDTLPVIGKLLVFPETAILFSWLGMFYDCLIIFFLTHAKTRPLAYISVIVFHVLTGMLFQIGVFPVVMIAATLIFFSDQWHVRTLGLLSRMFKGVGLRGGAVNSTSSGVLTVHPLLKYALATYVLFQLTFPIRHIFYPGNLFWTEEGYRFSWRVMLMEKAGTATFYVRDSKTNREGIVVNSEFLSAHQEKQMAMQPDMILQFAHFLKSHYEQQGVHDPTVRAEVYVTLNARPSKLLLDPTLDLTSVKDTWKHKSWILSYK